MNKIWNWIKKHPAWTICIFWWLVALSIFLITMSQYEPGSVDPWGTLIGVVIAILCATGAPAVTYLLFRVLRFLRGITTKKEHIGENITESNYFTIQRKKHQKRQDTSLILGILTLVGGIVFMLVPFMRSLFFIVLAVPSLIISIFATATSEGSKSKSIIAIILCVIASIIFFSLSFIIHGSMY